MSISRPALLGSFDFDGLRGNRADGLQAELGGNLQAEEILHIEDVRSAGRRSALSATLTLPDLPERVLLDDLALAER